MKDSGIGIFLGILSGFLYGCTPILIVATMTNGTVTGPACLLLRYLLTSVLLLPASIRAEKRRKTTRKQKMEIIVSGVLMSGTAVALYSSYRWLTAGIGMAITYLYPLFVLFGGRVFFRYKVSVRVVFASALSLASVFFLVSFDASTVATGAWKGVLLAIVSAVIYALFLLWNDERQLGEVSAVVFTEIMTVSCTGCLFLFNLATGQLALSLAPNDWLRIFAAGIIGPCATATQIMAIRRVGAMYTSILATLELVICCLGSALILHEPFSVNTILGTALIIAATILVTVDSASRQQLNHTQRRELKE